MPTARRKSDVASAKEIEATLVALKDEKAARHAQGFFKTGPGQYGEGDVFLGIRVPQVRLLAKQYRELPLTEVRKLLRSPYHEVRMLALILMADAAARGDAATKRKLYDAYLADAHRVNNWDLVDVSAHFVVGGYLLDGDRSVLDRLAESENLWERRIAIVSTLAFIRNHEAEDTLRIAELLLNDREDLIHKAVGWMLRELGKRRPEELHAFLELHAARMPRTMLRYAIERMTDAERRRYMAKKR